jgi:hypothetical protein
VGVVRYSGLENYTFLTPDTSVREPNVYAGRQEQGLEGYSNIPPGDQGINGLPNSNGSDLASDAKPFLASKPSSTERPTRR